MKELTLNQFEILTEEEKLFLLEEEGVFLDSVQENKWHAFLYKLHTFYVEVYIHPKRIKARRIRSFYNTHFLDRYLSRIDISSLGL
jgi:hypothetical protein